ncbi:MAG: hypothetical protein P4L92_20585 [Rudaea sp.]|nr:hypothetical protein [Rudaea sp.]
MFRFRSALATGLALVAISAHAVDPALFQDMHWRSIGPFRGGRVLAVSGVPDEPRRFYFGSVNGGVWETGDAGRTWEPIFDAQPVGSIGALAVAPSDSKVLYVGTGEADMRSDIAQGNGVYKSTDAGKTWNFAGLADSQQIGKILVHPRNPDLVYVAALGHPYGPNPERGVYRSRDGGSNWQKVLGKDDDTGAICIAFQPDDPGVIYAALWQTRRPPWNIYPPSSGPGSGLYKSTDGGDHWSQVTGHGFPATVGRIGLAISAAAPQRVYAIVDGEQGGLYRSDDGGANWTRRNPDPRIWQRGWYFGEIAADPKNADRLYALNTIVLRSDDGGASFIALKGDPTGDDFHALWIDPNESQRQILGVDQGALVTLNGGKTWSSWHNQPTAQIYHVSTDKHFPYRVYGSQQDSGAVSLPSRGDPTDGINMTHFRELAAGGESDNIAPDPDDPDIIFGGRVDKLDLRTQQVRNIDPTLATPDLYRGAWTLPLAFSPQGPHILYFANQRLFRTADRGEHWDAISPDLTRENPVVPKTLDAPAVADNPGQGPRRGVIYAIAPSPLAEGMIWTGTDDGLIWRTLDGGAHWQNVTPRALGDWSKVGIIDASPFAADGAYAAVDRHRLDDARPYIYRTRDGGKNWTAIVAGIPANQPVNVVRADPVRAGLLYAGTEKGIYISFDDGDRWQSLQKNLPVTSVRDITIHDADVVIATHGRGFWILDDVSALRQLDARVENATAWLFAPAPAYRVRHPDFTGTPLPKDEPMAASPPDGAYIDYMLKTAVPAPEQIALEILDASGMPVRRYSGIDLPEAPDPKKLDAAPEWTKKKSTLSTTPGMHRFVWPLRYPAPVAGKRDPFADGVWAPPGKYTVVLHVGDERLAQPLNVVADPRVNLPGPAYAEQFRLARQIETARAKVATAAREAAALVEQLGARRAAGSALAGDLDALTQRTHDIAGTRAAANPHNAWAFPPRSTRSLRFVAESLDKLGQAVDGDDSAPSADAQQGVRQIGPLVDACLRTWDAFKAEEVAALNDKLRAAGQVPIDLNAPGS